MGKKVSRRDFARTSVAAGAAAVALPGALIGAAAQAPAPPPVSAMPAAVAWTLPGRRPIDSKPLAVASSP